MSGNPIIFIALHRGADGFMSLKQFETFYWSGLKALCLGLIDADLTPWLFAEGHYDKRLHYFNELPKGKAVCHIDKSDIFRAKEIIGNNMCIAGNMPLSLLQTSTKDKVKDYSKRLIDIVGRDGGFIMSSNTVLDEAYPELVKTWVDYTKEFGVY